MFGCEGENERAKIHHNRKTIPHEQHSEKAPKSARANVPPLYTDRKTGSCWHCKKAVTWSEEMTQHLGCCTASIIINISNTRFEFRNHVGYVARWGYFPLPYLCSPSWFGLSCLHLQAIIEYFQLWRLLVSDLLTIVELITASIGEVCLSRDGVLHRLDFWPKVRKVSRALFFDSRELQ